MAGKMILIVEDEEDVMELIRYNLAREGFNCDAAYNGREALKKAQVMTCSKPLLKFVRVKHRQNKSGLN
ncbi:MAG: hypothetical protein KAJ46_04440 [Sedimentisphaerales bacterium]|nr:hypothetical protein [Sedimentisphaerales bacterium]